MIIKRKLSLEKFIEEFNKQHIYTSITELMRYYSIPRNLAYKYWRRDFEKITVNQLIHILEVNKWSIENYLE
jgi:hypothetical protein